MLISLIYKRNSDSNKKKKNTLNTPQKNRPNDANNSLKKYVQKKGVNSTDGQINGNSNSSVRSWKKSNRKDYTAPGCTGGERVFSDPVGGSFNWDICSITQQ